MSKSHLDIGGVGDSQLSTIILAVDNEEEENVEPALEPKWKFDRITSITIDEPIATWFHINKHFYKNRIQFLQSFL